MPMSQATLTPKKARWTPRSLAGLQFWIEGNDRSVKSFRKTPAGNAECIDFDECGRVNNYNGTQIAIQAVAGKLPVYYAEQVNSHGAIVGDGVDSFLALDSAIPLTGDFILGIAVQHSGSTVCAICGADPIAALSAASLETFSGEVLMADDAGNSFLSTTLALPTVTAEPVVIVVARSGSDVIVKANGTTEQQTPSPSLGTMTLESLVYSGSSGYGNAPVGCLVVATGYSAAKFSQLYNYLSSRFLP